MIGQSFGEDDSSGSGLGWWFEQEAQIRFPGDKLAVPDLSGWHLDQDEPLPPQFVFENPIVRRPDWCCEVLSPSTEKKDREEKTPLYAQTGVECTWLVDPIARPLPAPPQPRALFTATRKPS